MHMFLNLLDSLVKFPPWDLLALPKAQEPPGLVSSCFTTPALRSALPCEAPWGALCIVCACPEGSMMLLDGLLEAIPSLAGCVWTVHYQLKQTSLAEFPPAPFLTAWPLMPMFMGSS